MLKSGRGIFAGTAIIYTGERIPNRDFLLSCIIYQRWNRMIVLNACVKPQVVINCDKRSTGAMIGRPIQNRISRRLLISSIPTKATARII